MVGEILILDVKAGDDRQENLEPGDFFAQLQGLLVVLAEPVEFLVLRSHALDLRGITLSGPERGNLGAEREIRLLERRNRPRLSHRDGGAAELRWRYGLSLRPMPTPLYCP